MSSSKKQEQSLNSKANATESRGEFSKRMGEALKAYHEYHSAENMLKAVDAHSAANSERVIILEPSRGA